MRTVLLIFLAATLSCNNSNNETERRTTIKDSPIAPPVESRSAADSITNPRQNEVVDMPVTKTPDINDTLVIKLKPAFGPGYKVAAGTITNTSYTTTFENLCFEVTQMHSSGRMDNVGSHCMFTEKIPPRTTIRFETTLQINDAVTTLFADIKSVTRSEEQ